MLGGSQGQESVALATPFPKDPKVREIVEFLRLRAGRLWLVGGYVRDMLLGRETHDVDLIVPSSAISLARAVADHFGGAFFALDRDRDIGRALLSHDGQSLVVDISSLPHGGLSADLAQRDFTINALALDLSAEPPVVIDLWDGLADLLSRQIRAVSESCFRDDPVRTLRAVRFTAELGFVLEDQTARWLQRDGRLLAEAASERVRDELVRIAEVSDAAQHLKQLDQFGLLGAVLPELVDLQHVEQSAPHYLDAYSHTLQTVSSLEWVLTLIAEDHTLAVPKLDEPSVTVSAPIQAMARRVLRAGLKGLGPLISEHLAAATSAGRSRLTLLKWAALLHDVGKAKTRTVEPDGRIRFLGHEAVGGELTVEVLRRLRLTNEEARRGGTIVRHHMRPALLAREPALTRRAIYRYFRDTADAGVDTCILSLADHLATWGPGLLAERWAGRVNTAAQLLEAYFHGHNVQVAPPPLLTGTDLQQILGLQEGRRIGELLEAVREAQAAGEVQSREQALSLARELALG